MTTDLPGTLRMATDADMATLLDWRNDPAIRSMMYTQHVISPSEHAAWWDRIKASGADRVLVFERDGAPQGVVSFSDIDAHAGTAFWAFYASPDAPRGTGSLMEFAALEAFFSDPAMRKLSCEVLGRNTRVIALHRKFGFDEEGVFIAHKKIGDTFDDVHRLAIFRDAWHRQREPLRQTLLNRETK